MSAIVDSSKNVRQDECAFLLAEDRQWEALATDIMVNEAADLVDSLEQLLGSALKAVKTQRKDHEQPLFPCGVQYLCMKWKYQGGHHG